jgi:hypothetical protein
MQTKLKKINKTLFVLNQPSEINQVKGYKTNKNKTAI